MAKFMTMENTAMAKFMTIENTVTAESWCHSLRYIALEGESKEEEKGARRPPEVFPR